VFSSSRELTVGQKLLVRRLQTLERRVSAILDLPEGDGVGAGLDLGIVEAVVELRGRSEKALLQ
jgi:hypothetical protein